jgi:phosphoglycerate dehydrogenase-like enzyme
MAEALSLKVIFYDELSMMAIGQAQRKNSLGELLGEADFVVSTITSAPADSKHSQKLFGAREFGQMRKDAFFINATYGEACDLKALATALASGHLQGAAIDAYPAYCYSTTIANTDGSGGDTTVIKNPLLQMPNVILTPGIASNTTEVQARIATEVTNSILNYLVGDAVVARATERRVVECDSAHTACGHSLGTGTMHNAQCTMHNAQCTMHNAHRTRAPPWAPSTSRPSQPGPSKPAPGASSTFTATCVGC